MFDEVDWLTGDPQRLYRCIARIGMGASGEVFQVQHKTTQEVVAMKVMDGVSASDADLEQEVAIMKECHKCKFIVKCCGAWHQAKEDRICIAMEYCAGGSVFDIMQALKKDDRTLLESHVAKVCRQILLALVFLHEKNGKKYIHRDIKARNIMVNEDGQCKLSDFGISFIKRNTREKAKTMGRCTDHWMAPGTYLAYTCTHAYAHDFTAICPLFDMLWCAHRGAT